VLVVVGLVLVASLAVPVLAARWAGDRADAAEARAHELAALELAAPAPLQRATTPALSVRRIPATVAAATAERNLTARLDGLAAVHPETSCLVVWLDGQPVTVLRPDVDLVPASVMKLVTAAGALEVLGPEHRFATEIVTNAPVEGGVVKGDVWLVGGGDPLLSTDEYLATFKVPLQTYTAISSLARELAVAGVSRIDGRLIGDASRYDAVAYVPTWPDRYRAQNSVGPLSALAVNDGFVNLTTAKEGAPDPAAAAVEQFASMLAANGVTVAGGTAVGPAPDGTTILGTLYSPPLAEIVREMLTDSDNNTAELLVKEMGLRTNGDGSTAAGVAALASLVQAEEGSVYVDGSGLDRGNRLSCGQVVRLLADPSSTEVMERAVAVAGESGTLADRFADAGVAGDLHAKTGTLNGVNGLAGFLHRDAGRIVFAQLVNDPTGSALGLQLQDELARVLGTFPEAPAPADVGPLP
jgi:D-alanyl-D-alanine carboxypeptidase/D-alanyl-D-alanine-endopeptidase (penicillin-binding protein 4)